jgi:hypothetical protein
MLSLSSGTPALAAGPTDDFKCTANVAVTQNGAVVYSASRTFFSERNVTTTYSNTFTFNGKTISISVQVSCVNV